MVKRYSSYKDSDLLCVDVVPESWKKTMNKHHLLEKKVIVGEEWNNYKLLSLTKGGVIYRDVESGKGKFPESFDTYKSVVGGDLILCLYDIEETPRTIGLSDLDGMITGSYHIYEPYNMEGKFFYYWYLSIDNVKGLKPYYTGLRNVVRPPSFLSLPLYLPPLSEQQQIVSYLDEQTTSIDTLIQSKQKKITLLKEKRTSLINQIVTKGLNPNVEMKDSGVEWIGEIPSHWEVKKLKYFCEIVYEKGIPLEGDVKISPENVESNTGVCFNLYSEYSGEGVKFTIGDILLNKLRLYLKKILFTEYEGYSMGEMIVLRVFKGVKRFYFLTLFHQGLIDELDNQSTGVKLPRVSPEIIFNTIFPFPPPSEQMEIVEYLDRETELIDKTVSIEERKIELLKEYKQSLISEVITGKRKVISDE